MRSLESVRISRAHERVCRQRLAPLVNRYWQMRGRITFEEVLLSAYMQGISDGMQLPPKEKQPTGE